MEDSEFEDNIIEYMKAHSEIRYVSAVEMAHHFKRTYKSSVRVLKSLRMQRRLSADDISSKNEHIGQATGNAQIKKYQDPFYVYYLPNSDYLRRK